MAEDPIERALALLADVARREVAAHPRGHLLRDPRLHLPLAVNLPLSPDQLGERAGEAREALRQAIEEALAEYSALEPGRVLDLRTGEASGEASAPPDGRHVFVGYEANGAPRFESFPQWLLDHGHPDQEKLYRQPPGLITVISSERDLHERVLPAFLPESPPVRLRGQVAAGWFQVPRRDRSTGVMALTFHILQASAGRRRERWLLDILGAGPDGEPLEEVMTRVAEPAWRPAVLWAQQALGTFGSGRRKGQSLEQRLDGLLGGIARRLHQVHRGRDRRTGHAEKRHRGGTRPTRMAVADLEKAGTESILVDRRRDTLVVLGDRGRAHVWNPKGQLVTSIRYTPDSIERKKRAEIWRPATPSEAQDLRRAVARRGS